MNNKIERLYKDQPFLTDDVIKTIFKVAIKEGSGASIHMLLCLMTGRNLSVDGNVFDITMGHDTYFTFRTMCKFHNIPVGAANSFHNGYQHLSLPLPANVFDYEHIDMASDELESLLIDINTNLDSNITIKDIAAYMSIWLSKQEYRGIVVSILSGQAYKGVEGSKYGLIPISELHKAYESYLLHLFKVCGFDYVPTEPLIDGYVGSNMVAMDEAVNELFSELSIWDSIQATSGDEFQTRHNYYTLYTLLLFKLSTGHKKYKCNHLKASDINLTLKTAFIADGKFERVIGLPETTSKILNGYFQYLKSLTGEHPYCSTGTSDNFNWMLNGDVQLFHLFEDGALVPADKYLIELHLEDLLQGPGNWHRHFMRSKLIEHGVDIDILNVWMGDERLDEFSNISMREIYDVSLTVDKIICDLGIKVV